MARVAANQDRAEAERAHFVYLQHASVQSRRGSTVMCEEITESRVTPTPKGQSHTLLTLAGRVRDGKRTVRYVELPGTPGKRVTGTTDPKPGEQTQERSGDGDKEVVHDADAAGRPLEVNDTDIDLVENMRAHLTSDKNSKDGVNAGLFPLTSAEQKSLLFALKGQEQKNGRDTYHVIFRPKDKDDYGWKGDAWIDTGTLQPVVVRTALSRSLPLGVRALLGTNVPGLGFTAIYAPQGDGIWFPSSFGTEFKIRVLFFFERQMVVSVQNHDFERTHVSSTVHTEASAPIGPSSAPASQP